MRATSSLLGAAVLAAAMSWAGGAAAAEPDAPDAGATADVPFATGVGLATVGGLAAAGGAIAYTTFGMQPHTCGAAACDDPYRVEKGASIVTAVLGAGALAAGVPLIVLGEELDERARGRTKHRTAPLAPELRIGPGGGSLTWRF